MAHPDRKLAFLVFVLAALVLAPGVWFGFPSSKAVAGGLRVLQGELPYRDFWTMYAPGQFLAIAGLYRLFGAELIVQGLATIGILAATAALLFLLLRRLGAARLSASLVAALYTGLSWETKPELDSYPATLLLIVFGLASIEAHLRSGQTRHAVVAGVAYGLAATFKHDVAAYACIATGLGLLAGRALVVERPVHWPSPLRSILCVAGGALAILVPVVVGLALYAGRAAWVDLIVFPATDFRLIRSEAWPGLLPDLEPVTAWWREPSSLVRLEAAAKAPSRWLLAHLPEAAFALGLIGLIACRRALRPKAVVLGAIALCALPLYWWAAHTQPNTHLISMAVCVALLAGPLGPQLPRFGRVAVALIAALYAIGFLPRPAESALRTLVGGGPQVALERPGVRGVRVSRREAAYMDVIGDFVEANVGPREPIYCGVVRHDLPVIGNVRFHVLTGRPFAVRHHEIHPGITDHEDVQRETIEELERAGVRCLILWRFGGDSPIWAADRLEERREMRRAIRPEWGSQLLDDWIAANYRVVFEVDEYRVLWPRSEPDPELPPTTERGE